jgi:hypothetical protein
VPVTDDRRSSSRFQSGFETPAGQRAVASLGSAAVVIAFAVIRTSICSIECCASKARRLVESRERAKTPIVSVLSRSRARVGTQTRTDCGTIVRCQRFSAVRDSTTVDGILLFRTASLEMDPCLPHPSPPNRLANRTKHPAVVGGASFPRRLVRRRCRSSQRR